MFALTVPVTAQQPSDVSQASALTDTQLALSDAPSERLVSSPFANCASRTGTNATLIFPDTLRIMLGSEVVTAENVEVAVYNQGDRCAGHAVWDRESTALTAWGAVAPVPDADALVPGESLRVHVWLAEQGRHFVSDAVTLELSGAQPYLRVDPTYAPDAIYVVDTIHLRE